MWKILFDISEHKNLYEVLVNELMNQGINEIMHQCMVPQLFSVNES